MTAAKPLPEYYPDGDSRLAAFLAPRPRYNPWRQLWDQHPDYSVSDRDELPERTWGLCFMRQKKIQVCNKLDVHRRRCTIAHELVHIERGPVPSNPKFAEIEEEIVDEIASRRLIAFDDLVATIRECPNGAPSAWAYRLWVDRPTLEARFKNLRQQEIEAIDAIKTEAQYLTRSVDLIHKLRADE
ncbi:ImmA/IrrE family metallo-endopeptidase [Mycobacterium bourgelatii]|uniref:IrrE N-terminal-like domain-containing protein n=1 Tax=Mycobacterium bourgelatii TaxID=1273442 RepID=A0A7I9YMP2_MYCBU|nr:ImmA/IrrE family metallo-endopeptidase [Mycobacterium bourgelatii]MCV6975635.1 ImmA/IrrE family metallo-endopeptidase [Mycobacterium bourgelatii]GFG89951.1 hypothetical protein MBOU_19930 [Mycobacterium bourgelatii]